MKLQVDELTGSGGVNNLRLHAINLVTPVFRGALSERSLVRKQKTKQKRKQTNKQKTGERPVLAVNVLLLSLAALAAIFLPSGCLLLRK